MARSFAAEILAAGAEDGEEARRRALLDPSPHPDLVWLAPSGAQHLVEEVRERVIRAAAYRPFEGGRRVFVIEAAEALRDESQNALLKTLEEPPGFVHLILLSSEPALLLETVASRCQPVEFAPLPAAAVEAALRTGAGGGGAEDGAGADAAEVAAAARLSGGDVELARFLLGERGREIRAQAEGLAAAADDESTGIRTDGPSVGEPPWKALLDSAEAAGEEAEAATRTALEAEREAGVKRSARDVADEAKRSGRRRRTELLDLGLALAAAWQRDLAAVAAGAPEVVHNRDRLERLRAQAESLATRGSEGGAAIASSRRGVELVQDTRRRFALNVSEQLALEALASRLERTASDAVMRRPQSPK